MVMQIKLLGHYENLILILEMVVLRSPRQYSTYLDLDDETIFLIIEMFLTSVLKPSKKKKRKKQSTYKVKDD